MIDLSNYENYLLEVKSSKGNQPKWLVDGTYYKQDFMGYEGLSEYVVSSLLKKSTLKEYEFVEYKVDTIKSETKTRNGCYSKNFLKDGESLITLNRLYKNKYNRNLASDVFDITDLKQRAIFVVNKVSELTGIKGFGEYLTKIVEIDALFLNEDRHFNNIALIRSSDNNYSLCPIFDNGLALLSDTLMDYPLNEDLFLLIKKVKSKTIAWDFYEQIETFESLYGQQIKFNFSKKDVEDILSKIEIYDEKEIQRVKDIMFEQIRRLGYLFENNR